jgi:MFS family permease
MTNSYNVLNNRIPAYLPYLICSLASLFYLYEFVLQVSPSVMTKELMKSFGIGAAGVSMISAFYYYAYTPTQIIAGLLYDRFGPRRVLTVAIMICAIGAFFFSMTSSFAMASMGRFLMGIGSAFSFIGALMLVSRWFPAKYFALIAGVVQFMCAVGAICGQIPIAAAVGHFGWRHSLLWIAVFGLFLALLVSIIVKDHPPGMIISSPDNHRSGELSRLATVFGKPQTWWVGLCAFFSWGPVVIFAALWGIPYLAERYSVSTTQASTACAMIWLGMGLGSIVLGWLGDLISLRKVPIIICAVLAIVSGVMVLYVPNVSFHAMFFWLFLFGIAGSGQNTTHALVREINPPSAVGTAIGFNNMAIVLAGAILQPLSGIILHHEWSGKFSNGVPYYSANEYISAMGVAPLCGVAGLLITLFFIKETHCRSAVDNFSTVSQKKPEKPLKQNVLLD